MINSGSSTKKIKILIGTPIHQIKDYAMERWLENVSKLKYPADLIMIDNSPNIGYLKKVKAYCRKHKVKNYNLLHLDLPPEQKVFERVARCREIIRQKVLNGNYDAWFSWECDQLIPNDTLDELVKIMKIMDFDIVELNSWGREIYIPNYDWGVALIARKALERYSFILEFGTDPDMPDAWEPGEAWFRKRVLRGGGSIVDVDGVATPIYHLNTPLKMQRYNKEL